MTVRAGVAPLILDARSKESQEQGDRIPGAVAFVESALDSLASSLRSTAEVVVYCSCPNEASAAVVAKRLMKMGARRVRPLLGGLEAWVAAQKPAAS